MELTSFQPRRVATTLEAGCDDRSARNSYIELYALLLFYNSDVATLTSPET